MEEQKTEVIECPICLTKDWQNVDQFRMKPENMCLCKKCGFVTYPDKVKDTSKLSEFYEHDYRGTPTVGALFTGQRKLHYHNDFLSETFKKWKQEGKQPRVFEVGAAIGMVLHWIKEQFKQAEIYGSELNVPNTRIAKHQYGLDLVTDFDDSKKYDLIVSYKVAEHIPSPHKELRRYAEALTPDGFLYISVPIWFNVMTNFGAGGFTLEYYYHTNHINVWAQKNFETLLKKCGLKVVKENHVFYDSTYLCVRDDSVIPVTPEYDDPFKILDYLDRVKKASQLFDEGKFIDATKTFHAFPDAWINAYEMTRAEWHKRGFEAILKEVIGQAKAACPNSHPITMFAADLCMRYNQWDLATQFIDEALRQKPCDPGALVALGACYRQMGDLAKDENEKIKFHVEAREVTKFLQQTSFEHAHQSVSWMFADNAKIPVDFPIPKKAQQPQPASA